MRKCIFPWNHQCLCSCNSCIICVLKGKKKFCEWECKLISCCYFSIFILSVLTRGNRQFWLFWQMREQNGFVRTNQSSLNSAISLTSLFHSFNRKYFLCLHNQSDWREACFLWTVEEWIKWYSSEVLNIPIKNTGFFLVFQWTMFQWLIRYWLICKPIIYLIM